MHALQSWLPGSATSPAATKNLEDSFPLVHELVMFSVGMWERVNPTQGKKRGPGKDPAVWRNCGPCCPIPALLILLSQKKASAGASTPLQCKEEGRGLNPPWTDPIRCGASSAAERAGVMLGQETDVRLICSWRACACFCSLG